MNDKSARFPKGTRIKDTAPERRAILDLLEEQGKPAEAALALRELIAHLRRIRPDIISTHSSKAGILGRLAGRSLDQRSGQHGAG